MTGQEYRTKRQKLMNLALSPGTEGEGKAALAAVERLDKAFKEQPAEAAKEEYRPSEHLGFGFKISMDDALFQQAMRDVMSGFMEFSNRANAGTAAFNETLKREREEANRRQQEQAEARRREAWEETQRREAAYEEQRRKRAESEEYVRVKVESKLREKFGDNIPFGSRREDWQAFYQPTGSKPLDPMMEARQRLLRYCKANGIDEAEGMRRMAKAWAESRRK